MTPGLDRPSVWTFTDFEDSFGGGEREREKIRWRVPVKIPKFDLLEKETEREEDIHTRTDTKHFPDLFYVNWVREKRGCVDDTLSIDSKLRR